MNICCIELTLQFLGASKLTKKMKQTSQKQNEKKHKRVNEVVTWGKLHGEIVEIIKNEKTPITCVFRMPPPLKAK